MTATPAYEKPKLHHVDSVRALVVDPQLDSLALELAAARAENRHLLALVEAIWQHAEPSIRDPNLRDEILCVLKVADNG